MGDATLPLPAKVHAGLARVLEWVWPRGAAWAYADAIAHAPHHPELHFRRGQALGRAGRWPEAASSFAAAARLAPSSVEHQGALVVALDRAKREPDLVDALRRFAELRPGEGEVHVLLGAILRRCGRAAEALHAFRLAVRLETAPSTRRFVLGEALLGAEGWRAALAAWSEARQVETASGGLVLGNAGRSALNFHPGPPMSRVPRRPSSPAARGPGAWLRERGAGLKVAALRLLRGDPTRPRGAERVKAIQKAWRKAHPGVAPRKPSGPLVTVPALRIPSSRGRRRARPLAVALALGLVATAAGAAQEPAPPRRETAAAREQARLCERLSLGEGAAACRAALALGVGPDRRGPVRQKLARHLVALEKWDELADLLRENVRLAPDDGAAWQRLGLVLLFALGEPQEAIGALQEATRREPTDASARLALGLALHAGGRVTEAVEAIEAALRLDPAALDGRPAARAILDAARRGETWP